MKHQKLVHRVVAAGIAAVGMTVGTVMSVAAPAHAGCDPLTGVNCDPWSGTGGFSWEGPTD